MPDVQTIPYHDFLLKVLQELETAEFGSVAYATHRFATRMLTEVSVPEKHKKEVIEALVAFMASGKMLVDLEEETVKAYLRLDQNQEVFRELCSSSHTIQQLKNREYLQRTIARIKAEDETVAVPARPGLYEGATVPLKDA